MLQFTFLESIDALPQAIDNNFGIRLGGAKYILRFIHPWLLATITGVIFLTQDKFCFGIAGEILDIVEALERIGCLSLFGS